VKHWGVAPGMDDDEEHDRDAECVEYEEWLSHQESEDTECLS
jgi:hypothetical protein